MKKLLLALFSVLAVASVARAGSAEDWNYIPISSYTDAATAGPALFSSATIQFVGVSIASPAANGYVAIYRSTTPVFTADIATQTIIGTDDNPINSDVFIPLYEMKNTSYTFISKVGLAQVTFWFRCPPPTKNRTGLCPGLPWSGRKNDKITFE